MLHSDAEGKKLNKKKISIEFKGSIKKLGSSGIDIFPHLIFAILENIGMRNKKKYKTLQNTIGEILKVV